jgi:hypothetical protein
MAAMTGRVSKKMLWPILLGAVLLPGLASLSRCFSPTLPACSFICNKDEPRCPDDYECRGDNYCHLRGSSEACPYSMDLAPPQYDLSPPPDMSAVDL